MSCKVATSPFSDPGLGNLFDESATRPNIDLSAITDFNDNFNALGDNTDPLNLSNTGSPTYSLDQTLSPGPSFNFYPELTSPSEAPYFNSTEQAPATFVPPALHQQYLHRRSVSEPPDGALTHHRPQAAGIVFHRDGHRLGVPVPRSSYALPAKKMKPSRSQPYPRAQVQPQNRYQPRRAYTQSSPRAPTSMPNAPMMRPMAQHMPGYCVEPISEEQHYTASRVCTPAPEIVDPMLVAPPMQAPTVPQMNNFGVETMTPVPKAVVIKMGVDELRALITEVVQKAMDGVQAVKIESNIEETIDVAKVDEAKMSDEIVVAAPLGDSVVETIEERSSQDI